MSEQPTAGRRGPIRTANDAKRGSRGEVPTWLLPYLDFDLERFERNVEAVHPGVPRLRVSAKSGEGLAAWSDWMAATAGRRVA